MIYMQPTTVIWNNVLCENTSEMIADWTASVGKEQSSWTKQSRQKTQQAMDQMQDTAVLSQSAR